MSNCAELSSKSCFSNFPAALWDHGLLLASLRPTISSKHCWGLATTCQEPYQVFLSPLCFFGHTAQLTGPSSAQGSQSLGSKPLGQQGASKCLLLNALIHSTPLCSAGRRGAGDAASWWFAQSERHSWDSAAGRWTAWHPGPEAEPREAPPPNRAGCRREGPPGSRRASSQG